MNFSNTLDSYQIFKERSQYFPSETTKVHIAEPTTLASFDVDDTDCIINSQNFDSLPIWRVKSGLETVLLTKPIKVKIERGKEMVFVCNENIEIYASGESLFEAFEDFGEQLIYFYNYYKRFSLNQLTGKGIELKEIYENIFTNE